MDLQLKLKTDTKPYHDKIESAALFQKIVNNQISLSEYRLLLEKIYGFIKPIEDKLDIKLVDNTLKINKALLVQSDLIHLTESTIDFLKLNLCSTLQISTLENSFGYLYVMEGSTLGGQVLTQLVGRQLNLTPQQGCRYFYGYGKDTLLKWRQFCDLLNSMSSHLNQQELVASAIATFNEFYEWLEA